MENHKNEFVRNMNAILLRLKSIRIYNSTAYNNYLELLNCIDINKKENLVRYIQKLDEYIITFDKDDEWFKKLTWEMILIIERSNNVVEKDVNDVVYRSLVKRLENSGWNQEQKSKEKS